MYCAIYGRSYVGNKREHVGNVTDVSFTHTKRTFDFNTTTVTGKYDFELTEGLIAVMKDKNDDVLFAGFVKNIKPVDDYFINFQIDDFRRILDTDMLLDFTQEATPSHNLDDMFQKIADGISLSSDPAMTILNINFSIPTDATDTKTIADYTGQYMIVNALKFLKVYLSYYSYYINTSYDDSVDVILFTFTPQPTEQVEIKLSDFTHEKSSNDIKLNKVIATVSFNTAGEGDPTWDASTQTYWNSLPPGQRAEHVGALPSPDGYPSGFGLKVYEDKDLQATDLAGYTAATSKSTVTVASGLENCPGTAPTLAEVLALINIENYPIGHVFEAYYYTTLYTFCFGNKSYFEVVGTGTIEYYQVGALTFIARPNMPQKIYTLGLDNQIYDDYAPNDQRILPIVEKLFEAQYLYEAQLNAVYELVNNRYVENIIITESDVENILDLSSMGLYTIIRVYDDDATYKDLPISEITMAYKKSLEINKIKLGFKKTLLTEILKVTDDTVVRQSSIAGNTTVIQDIFHPHIEEIGGSEAPAEVEVGEMFFKKI